MRSPCLISIILVIFLTACAPLAAQPPVPTPTIDRLAAPVLPEQPTQADRGAYVYYQVCMACHGDRGQGLTDEWRAVWGEDQNCWQSECHGNNHPIQGFRLKKEIPAVAGASTLTRFRDALQLHQYVAKAMPWWKPGYLEPDQFWEVTAFLLRAQKALPTAAILKEDNAAIFFLRPASPPPGDGKVAAILLSVFLALAAILRISRPELDKGKN